MTRTPERRAASAPSPAPPPASRLRSPERRGRARKRARGFTLIEITVALAAGLIVTVGIMALSREATNTFHEEARSASAQMSLRTAVDRLRADLQRAAYMSTANIVVDPKITRRPDETNIARIPAGYAGLRRLAGLRLDDGGSAGGAPLSAVNGLSPDAIEIGGNFTTTDAFVIRTIDRGLGQNGCDRIWLATDSPPMWRIAAAAGEDQQNASLRNAFTPTSPTGAAASAQFIVRFADNTGHVQYVATCASAQAASFNNGAPYIDIAADTPILLAEETGGLGGFSGLGVGCCTVNPVQIVRWAVGRVGGDVYEALREADDPTKYELTRTFVDARGDAAGLPEVIAEYAVDLKFAFTVDAAEDDTGRTPLLVTFPFDDTRSATEWGYGIEGGATPRRGPQRIRAVRARLATRTQLPDRTAPIAAPANYVYRYCTVAGGCEAGRRDWARVRTVSIEVSLPNQAREFY
jgi:prepilin-type N-terminal cleavage/methylation domain-containing protein